MAWEPSGTAAAPVGDVESGFECGSCGEPLEDWWCFCPRCGTEVDWNPEPIEDINAFDVFFDR